MIISVYYLIELNTSFFKKGNEPYPSKRIMQMLADAHIPVLLSDDAHAVSQLGQFYNQAEELAKSCGLNINSYQETFIRWHQENCR